MTLVGAKHHPPMMKDAGNRQADPPPPFLPLSGEATNRLASLEQTGPDLRTFFHYP
jgi:hypothetical protein